jgi:hypothetical protein
MAKSNGVVLYRGPSRLDGSPIVAILTGIRRESKNPKTGKMLQVWILRSDVNPTAAVETGADYGICGDCQFRPVVSIAFGVVERSKRRCYVNLRGPQSIYKAFRKGSYPDVDYSTDSRLMAGKSVRLGAYGDPASIPVSVWDELLPHCAKHTGYTHQWHTGNGTDYRRMLMASVDSPIELESAQVQGWRTFRVRTSDQVITKSEISCPASAESGYRTQCDRCTLCAGSDKVAKSVSILAHGSGVSAFVTLASLRAQ